MKCRSVIWMFGAAILLAGCSNDDSVKVGSPCNQAGDCGNGDLICYQSSCIRRCSPDSCEGGTYCSAGGLCIPNTQPECSESQPCADATKTCISGRCLVKPECSDNEPCADPTQKCVSGRCVAPPKDAECSNLKPCADPAKKCTLGQCLDFVEPAVCYSDAECQGSRICDNGRCMPEGSCSKTRKCVEGSVCRNGSCVTMDSPECSSAKPCADKSKTCVAGKCIQCSCGADEICNYDGSCAPANTSADKTIAAGQVCTYPDSRLGRCDGNHFFSCSKQSGVEEDYTIKVTQCSASVCAYTSEDMLGCYDPCTHEGDFIGECFNDYISESDTYQALALMQICEKRPDGALYWTYSEAPQHCKAGCHNGNCDFVPEEYGQTCTKGVYKDKCQGDWLLFCESSSYQMALVYGENCKTSYSQNHYCESSESGEVGCVLPCQESENGQVKQLCHSVYDGIYSETWKCEKTVSGDYAWFMQTYYECSNTCNDSTGSCN